MNWLDILYKIFEIALVPIFAAATVYLVSLIHQKKKQIISETNNELTKKYVTMLDKTITECVIATNQTYVNTLKAQGSFDAEAQKEAFKRTYDAVVSILTEDAEMYLSNAIADLETYITNRIETEVVYSKNLLN